MTALAGGLVALILGIIGIVVWWSYLLEILMGVIPVMLILGGALAAYLGIEEMKDKRATERVDTENVPLKSEPDTLKQELKDPKDKTPSQS
jgi:hypothetical protein